MSLVGLTLRATFVGELLEIGCEGKIESPDVDCYAIKGVGADGIGFADRVPELDQLDGVMKGSLSLVTSTTPLNVAGARELDGIVEGLQILKRGRLSERERRLNYWGVRLLL